jgi:replicative DNA helicase
MSNIKAAALEYLSYNLSVIPATAEKRPTMEWSRYKEERMTAEEVEKYFKAPDVRVAIITGAISQNLEVIDVDTKHDPTGTLWDELSRLLQDNLPEIYSSLVIAQTISGGYHLYYKAEQIQGNQKLAKRTNGEVLVETRGEGGLVVAPPSNGYTYLQGHPSQIPIITQEQRELALAICKGFNQLKATSASAPKSPSKPPRVYNNTTSLEDFDQRGDTVELLVRRGWTVVKEEGDRIYLRRAGDTKSEHSANYHKPSRALIVWSSSTEFEAEKPYSPSAVYNLLESAGDWTATAKALGALGYGDPAYRPAAGVTQVHKVNEVTRVNSVNIKIETRKNPLGEEAVITAPADTPEADLVRAIEEQMKADRRTYIKLGSKAEERDYAYLLNRIFNKYGTIQQQQGALAKADTDKLLDEVVILGAKLNPLDRAQLKNSFLNLDPIQALGITPESLDVTIERLAVERAQEAQKQKLKELIAEAAKLQEQGNTAKALELLSARLYDVKQEDKKEEFKKLLQPITEQQVKDIEAASKDGLDTGYTIAGEDLRLPSGAISVFAAPTNHGKTLMLINTVLNAAENYPDKKFLFLSYEERDTAILQYFLNAYVDEDLNSSKTANRRLYKDYFKTGSTVFIKQEKLLYFEGKKEEFFRDYIESGRILIKYIDHNSEELESAIRYAYKNEPTLGGVFIDYFQLINLPEAKAKGKSRQQELKDVCIQLKNTAVATGLPICLAAQFNREVTNLMRLHPTNIGEAGDVERIVNTLIGLWNMNKKPDLKGITDAEATEVESRKTKAKSNGTYSESSIYVEILKSRELPTGGYEFLELQGNTGRITQRDRVTNPYIRYFLRLQNNGGVIISNKTIQNHAGLNGWDSLELLAETVAYFEQDTPQKGVGIIFNDEQNNKHK